MANYDKFVSLNNADPRDVSATHEILAFRSNEDEKPITSIKLALSKPCFDPNFPSGLENDDNSIYQIQDYEFMFANVDTNVDTNSTTTYGN